jgi:hypothetical protein
METEAIRKTLDHYRKLREQKIAGIKSTLDEITGYDLIIRRLADDLKEPANLEPLKIGAPTVTTAAEGEKATDALRRDSAIVKPSVRRDEFFQMSQSAAARAYLKMVGRAVLMDELLNALRAGGAQVGGTDPKRTLYVSLKANKKDFVWPNKDTVGLAEFYQRRK